MATTKTIQPTGTTITIPEFTDQPDIRPVATDLSNITDAANALNTKIGDVRDAYDIGTQTSLSGLQTALESIAASMDMGESKLIRFLSGSSGFETFRASVRYYGYLFCTYISGTRIDFCITFTSNLCDSISMGRQNGTWRYNDVEERFGKTNGSTNNPLTNLNDISVNTMGITVLSSSIAPPNGSVVSLNYVLFGIDSSKTLICSRPGSSYVWINFYSSSEWKGWKTFTTT